MRAVSGHSLGLPVFDNGEDGDRNRSGHPRNSSCCSSSHCTRVGICFHVSSCTMDRLLTVHNSEIVISFEIGLRSVSSVRMRNVMHTMPVAFKVLTTCPKRYAVKPPLGIIPPLGEASFEVVMHAQSHLPEEFPLSSDRFQVKSLVVPSGNPTEAVLNDWFTTRKKQVFVDAKLRVVFVGGPILRHLVSKGTVEAVKDVLARDSADLDQADHQSRTALHIAAARGKLEMVRLLLERGAGLEVRSKTGQSPLHEATFGGHAPVVKLLLASRADTEAKNPRGWTALHLAATWNRTEVLKLLLEAGANVDAADNEGRTALHAAATEGNTDSVDILLRAGARIDSQSQDGRTALHRAATKGYLDIVELLLERGATKEVRCADGRTAYAIAVEKGKRELLEPLLLGSLFANAARKGDVGKMMACVHKGATVGRRDQHGWTPLHRAAFKGHLDAVQWLLDNGADVSARDTAGYTALHCAAETGQTEVVHLLLTESTADLNASTDGGFTPLRLALDMGRQEVADLLVEWKGEKTEAGKALQLVSYSQNYSSS